LKRILPILLLIVAACTPKIPPPGEQPPPPAQPSPAAAIVNEALAMAREGKYPEAVLRMREAIEADGGFAEAYARLGILYRRLGRLEDARASLAEALEITPKNSEYLYAMGATLFDLGDYGRAERSFRESWSLDGRLPALFSLGETLHRRGKRSQAAEVWREYLRRDEDSVWGREAARRLDELASEDARLGR